MQPVIVQMIIMLYAAFGCMFLFMNWQHPARFSRLMAQSWLLETVRAGIILSQLDEEQAHHWHSLADCLNLVATWWLVAGCADLTGIKLSSRLGRLYLGIGIPLVLVLRYLAPVAAESWFGLAPDRARFLSVQVELFLLFSSVAIMRMAILWWLIRLWRTTRLPGALLAIVFGVPYIGFALLVPFQFTFNYYPEWIYLTWAGRVLGFSLGLVMLLFDRQLDAHRASEARIRRFIDSNIQGVLICTTRGARSWKRAGSTGSS
jgi:two-component system cell cycle sensor histidine kinase/response regulator CckA